MAQFITSSSTAAVDTSLRDNYTEYAKKSRHGHGQDVLDANNIRQVAGCLLLDLPKGGWETDETQRHAAQRETWEEAGIKKKILKAHHWIFEMELEQVAKKFPERKKRDRRWFTFEEPIFAIQDHRYIQEAILRSSLKPSFFSKLPPSPSASVDGNDDDLLVEQQRKHDQSSINDMHTSPSVSNDIATQTLPAPASNTTKHNTRSIIQTIKSIFI